MSIGISGSVTDAAIARRLTSSHQSPLGWARATTCISASIRVSASVWPRPDIGADLRPLDAGDREHLVEHDVDLRPDVVGVRSSA